VDYPPPQAVIIAGPNGSGKSTVATHLLPEGVTFVNADHIASEVAGVPGTPGDINAGRVLIEWVRELEEKRADFAFETTLATRMLETRIRIWRKLGYQVHLFFFWLPSADLAVQRVQSRVRSGGHDVPESTIIRRFQAGIKNFFNLYRPLVDTWRIYDNSSEVPRLIAKGEHGTVKIGDSSLWENILEANNP
jgi:predicted ABC-type ATPase